MIALTALTQLAIGADSDVGPVDLGWLTQLTQLQC